MVKLLEINQKKSNTMFGVKNLPAHRLMSRSYFHVGSSPKPHLLETELSRCNCCINTRVGNNNIDWHWVRHILEISLDHKNGKHLF